MSKIDLFDVCELNGKFYGITSCYTEDWGFDTRIYECDENGEVTDFLCIYEEKYSSAGELKEKHFKIVNSLEYIV